MFVRRLSVFAAVAVALVGGIAGCSDDGGGSDGPGGEPSSVVSGSATEETSPSADSSGDVPQEPVPPEAMEKFDEAGAKAFAEFYWEVVNYAQATGDIDPMVAIEREGCAGCSGPREWVAQVYADGGRIEGGVFESVDITVAPLRNDGSDDVAGYSAEMTMRATESTVYDAAGNVDEESAATELSIFMLMSRDGGAWVVDDWQVRR